MHPFDMTCTFVALRGDIQPNSMREILEEEAESGAAASLHLHAEDEQEKEAQAEQGKRTNVEQERREKGKDWRDGRLHVMDVGRLRAPRMTQRTRQSHASNRVSTRNKNLSVRKGDVDAYHAIKCG